jgi:tagatose 6-phosphate kinase
VGGCNGDFILTGLDAEDMKHDFVRTAGESRLCIAVVDPDQGTQTEVNEAGVEVTFEEVRLLRSKLSETHGWSRIYCSFRQRASGSAR